jgi:hypothetical protein
MPLQHALRGGQADARSRKLTVLVHPLKRAKQRASESHIEADAVVPQIEGQLVPMTALAEFDSRLSPWAGELRSVA